MPLTRSQKTEILSNLTEAFKKAKSVIFTDFRGLKVHDANSIRGKLREQGLSMKVAKKTLIKMAAKEAGVQEIDENLLEGPISITISNEDELLPAKLLHTFFKEGLPLQIRGGFMNGQKLLPQEIKQLALIPAKPALLAQLVWTMNAPISGFHGVLSSTLSGFVRVLSAIQSQKEPSSS